MDSKYNDNFYEWDEKKHVSVELGHVLENHGERHGYLGIILNFSKKYHVGVDMRCHQESMGEDFSVEIKLSDKAPWSNALLKIDNDSAL